MEYLDVVDTISRRTAYTRKEVRRVMREITRLMCDQIERGGHVRWTGLGKFENLQSQKRNIRNPVTGVRRLIPPARRLKFIPSDRIKKALKKSLAVFQEESLVDRYLPKEKHNGQASSSHRPEEGRGSTEGKESWKRKLFGRPKLQRAVQRD